MGFRNLQQITTLAKYGKLNNKRGHITSFSADEFAILSVMALQSADYPLDIDAKKKKLMPRTYMYGWLELASALGMIVPDNTDNITVVNNEPHDLRKERSAISRISRIVAKLKAKGLVKCLKTGRYSKHSSAVWLLTIGDEEENKDCEKYVRRMLNLDTPVADAQPQPNNGMLKHTAQTIPPTAHVEPNQALLALLSMPTKTMQQADNYDKIEETTTPVKEEEVNIKKNLEIEQFKREHEGLSPFQYFKKYGHNAPDIQRDSTQDDDDEPWYPQF